VIARSAAAERLMPGELVDDFLVWERVHTGEQGVVYRVTGRDTGFPLLMKVPRFQTGDSAASLINYETEAMIVPALSGPHVPRFVAAGDLRRTPYIVLEQVEGESLEKLLVRCPLPGDEVARIGAALADALHSLHRQGAVHCDVKPDNVILRPDGEAVLIDFGLAWHERFPDLLAEEKWFAAGSAPYLSPEQLLGVRGDPRSDVYSLGAVLYELATGELPFGIPGTEGGLRQRLWMDPDPPAVLSRAVTPALQETILRCLEPQADRRYQSAAHVAFDLRNPEQVPLTARALRTVRSGFLTQTRRWWDARVKPMRPPQPVKRALDACPVIMVAVDTTNFDDERQPAIRRATRQVLAVERVPPRLRFGREGATARSDRGAGGARRWPPRPHGPTAQLGHAAGPPTSTPLTARHRRGRSGQCARRIRAAQQRRLDRPRRSAPVATGDGVVAFGGVRRDGKRALQRARRARPRTS
jgi:serine/threonine protein kinase